MSALEFMPKLHEISFGGLLRTYLPLTSIVIGGPRVGREYEGYLLKDRCAEVLNNADLIVETNSNPMETYSRVCMGNKMTI